MKEFLLDPALWSLAWPLIYSALAAIGAWLVTRLPGPLREWLQSGTHQRDMELLLGAMARRALAGRVGGVTDLVNYAQSNLPDTVAKLAPSEDALRTIAAAALVRAAQKL